MSCGIVLIDDDANRGAALRTSGWQNWETIRANDVYLTPGPHRLKVVALSDLFNVNWISVERPQ
jgi:hypothetical protein